MCYKCETYVRTPKTVCLVKSNFYNSFKTIDSTRFNHIYYQVAYLYMRELIFFSVNTWNECNVFFYNKSHSTTEHRKQKLVSVYTMSLLDLLQKDFRRNSLVFSFFFLLFEFMRLMTVDLWSLYAAIIAQYWS